MVMTTGSWLLIFVYFATLITFVLFMGLVVMYLTSAVPNISRLPGEQYYKDHAKREKLPFPQLDDLSSVDLSVIIPSYNEEVRLPKMLDECLGYLENRKALKSSYKYEVIVVDDGSTDRTSEVALKYSEKYGTEKVRVLTLVKNRGKGGAVRMGMLSSRGKELLFADADGATTFRDLEKLEIKLREINNNHENAAIVCGSRAHLEKESIAQRAFYRTLLMYCFKLVVTVLCSSGVRKIKDTQCGFKLLTRPAARLVFYNLHVDRWAFDVDMLHIASHFKIPVGEIAVEWTEIEGSKVVPIFSWIQMAKDLLLIRLRYMTGAWTIERKIKSS